MDDLTKEAAKVIQRILYINLATITPPIGGKPWNTPVFTAFDEELNFYWASYKLNQHSINIKNNPNVFATIYDSTVAAGTGFGVYFQGKAHMLIKPKNMLIATKVLYKRSNKKPREIMQFLRKYPRRLYQFKPEKVWANGDGDIKGNFIDIRTELSLEELIKAVNKISNK